MGVASFWQLMEDAESTLVSLSECSGQKWAVDFTPWIVHGRTAADKAVRAGGSVNRKYLMMKTIFHRTLCLLRHGIIPVIVMDGNTAPLVKEATLQRRSQITHGSTKAVPADRSSLVAANEMCNNMLKSLGLTVIVSQGEAEKTCAYLNKRGIVDACLTDDADAFLYGAETVYRHLDVSEQTVLMHTMQMIQDDLGLNRHDLIVMALLSGCDYGNGVASIGPKKVCELIKSIKEYDAKVENVLSRVLNWREDGLLKTLSQKEEMLQGISKESHCSQCDHPGRVSQHQTRGCQKCRTSEGCKDTNLADPCDCPYHIIEHEVTPYKTELSVWRKALEKAEFPDRELVKEFLEEDSMPYPEIGPVLPLPDWMSLSDQVYTHLKMNQQDMMKTLIPVLIHMHLYDILLLPDAKPLSILKKCKRNFIQCYQVLWERFAFDHWTPSVLPPQEQTPTTKSGAKQDVYTLDIQCELMEKKYPALVKQFEENSAKEKGSSAKKKSTGKRAAEDPRQRKLTDMFTVKRRLFDEGSDKDT